MSQKPKKWPDYALNSLEGALHYLKSIDELAREVKAQLSKGDPSRAVTLTDDIRTLSIDARDLLHQARTGNYDR